MGNKNKDKDKASSYGVEVTPWTLNPIPPVRSRVRAILFKLDGAEEACWAHNPKVTGSKPVLAIIKNYNITNYIQTQLYPNSKPPNVIIQTKPRI